MATKVINLKANEFIGCFLFKTNRTEKSYKTMFELDRSQIKIIAINVSTVAEKVFLTKHTIE